MPAERSAFLYESPLYRVHFFERPNEPPERVADERVSLSFTSDEYEVEGAADVNEVLAWANENSRRGNGQIYPGADRTYVIHALVTVRDEVALVRLAGHDPN